MKKMAHSQENMRYVCGNKYISFPKGYASPKIPCSTVYVGIIIYKKYAMNKITRPLGWYRLGYRWALAVIAFATILRISLQDSSLVGME